MAAGRAACGYGYRELAEAASVATTWLMKIVRMPSIKLRASRGRGAEGIEPESMRRLLDVFRRHGLELRGAAAGHHAMLLSMQEHK